VEWNASLFLVFAFFPPSEISLTQTQAKIVYEKTLFVSLFCFCLLLDRKFIKWLGGIRPMVGSMGSIKRWSKISKRIPFDWDSIWDGKHLSYNYEKINE